MQEKGPPKVLGIVSYSLQCLPNAYSLYQVAFKLHLNAYAKVFEKAEETLHFQKLAGAGSHRPIPN
jgi:hypothetical protein